ncbi:Adenine nucleotide alpha hydrolases-like superfamily protein isoform 1 [Hibiscus syriacus]|uniref:Adenine nucleotide alpha hydrolases-like superfamily protein isoform 1 n=2 Tax=Hibiscus syriacus TaxID=106335 RepID=A0A6A2ZIP2_HIBSY|nr:Adenine nucleotide alpha hydrolases-like superfamily protein isoform 1 [Hibiscus syriacus]
MKCELCGKLARMHCESDQANICWDCDLKVHGANFLVAKHNRTLLCHVCQNPTPWLASGRNLGSAVTVCDSCFENRNDEPEVTAEESSEGTYGEEEEDEDYDDEAVEEEVEDAENQVVPWSADSSSLSLLKPVLECSSDDGGGFGLRRMRENQSFCSDDEIGCSSSLVGSGGWSNGEASSSMGSSRFLKQPRLAEVHPSARNEEDGEPKSRSTAVICYLKRLQKHTITNDDDASATITGICRLRRDQSR